MNPPHSSAFTILSVEDAQESIMELRKGLLVLDVWSTEDDTWQIRLPSARPILVDQSHAYRLDQVWPVGRVPGPAQHGPVRREHQALRAAFHVLTITEMLPRTYLHVFVGQRPSFYDIWTIMAIERLQMKFMLGVLRNNMGGAPS